MKKLNLKMFALTLLMSTTVLAQHNSPPVRRPLPPPIPVQPAPVILPPVNDNGWSQREILNSVQVNQVLNGQAQILPVRATLRLQPGQLVRKVIVIAMSRQGGGRLEVLVDGRPALITSNGMQSYEKTVGTSLETIEAEVNGVVGQSLQTLQLRTDGSVLISLVGATIQNQIVQPRPQPIPMPQPIPQPLPRPNPYPIPPAILACSQEAPNVYQATFQRVKNFAYSGSGLNLSTDAATSYALEWTSRNPCVEADGFLRRVSSLKDFAYSGSGLNMSSEGARQFALENESRVCVQDNSFVNEFKTHYNFAYSSSGLNMSSQGARDYAWSKIQPNYFNCRR